ncbi:hypothetical protein FF011L_50520 [Roseimaritima multifibrata]|uniref:Sialate O-acetylesterase domain-containing protein n=1 Tax=Roseimaritima multifibrata TaxID=1930274 RepID=A0A517MN07_9BACT|nr:sialate O-acetylesterase [Roseimaritima multifibrata]QDS96244.1 hypothetical protein FF011L_50520 [Roseimaritima multifibrata]
MPKVLRFSASLLLAAAAACSVVSDAVADVRLPNIFSDHMVLQRDQPNRVWGRADSGEQVTVKIGGQSHAATADAEGNWQVTLDPMKVGEPLELAVQGKNTVTVKDILVGEVWICSGQSNMQWNVGNSNDFDLEKAAANYPQIRMINYPRVGTQEAVWSHDAHHWMVCSPDTVGSFSAVGYFFGRQLYQTLGIPIGLVNNAWGGSAAEAWVPRETLAKNPEMYGPMLKRWESMEEQAKTLQAKTDRSDAEEKHLTNLKRALPGNQNPGNIYNGVLKSHIGYGIRGAIWYQGESNAGRAYQYRDLFPLMISQWRSDWGQGDFPFYWVQLADFRPEVAEPGDSSWAELREAQTMTMDKLPNTGEAVIIDKGEAKDIHPRNKQIVGGRLARWALANEYGLDMDYQSPRYASMEKEGNQIVLTFDKVGAGWRPFDVNELRGFSIAGEDRKFVWADAEILPDGRIAVSSGEVAEPVAVRYAWAENPVVNLYNKDDLPLTPFRTDDWPGITKDAR